MSHPPTGPMERSCLAATVEDAHHSRTVLAACCLGRRTDMVVTSRGWQVCAVVYRALVVVQTLGWVVSSFARVVARQPRSSLSIHPIGAALAAGSVVGIAAGVLTYYVRRSQSYDRNAVVLAWAWFQAAGFLALAGYVLTGMATCFIVGIVTLAVMHAFSPNHFR